MRLFYGALAVVLSCKSSGGQDLGTFRGPEMVAVTKAINRFEKIYARPDLQHYSVRLTKSRSTLEITFIPDQPKTYQKGTAGTGGATMYGPAMTYTVSLKTAKVLDYNFQR